MNDPSSKDLRRTEKEWEETVGSKETRKIEGRNRKDRSILFGLGMFGLVGWSVAIPTVIGIAIGVWIDAQTESRYSWTLMLLFAGVALGCLNAWLWVKRESEQD